MNQKIVAKAVPSASGGFRAIVQEGGLTKVVSINRFRDRNVASNVARDLFKLMTTEVQPS